MPQRYPAVPDLSNGPVLVDFPEEIRVPEVDAEPGYTIRVCPLNFMQADKDEGGQKKRISAFK